MTLDDSNKDLRGLAARADAHDAGARKALFETLYAELHRLAESHVRRHQGELTLGATTLLHEAYLAISQRDGLAFPDRPRFFAYASRAMRGLVVDYVRQKRAQKRGGTLIFTTLEEAGHVQGKDVNLEQLNLALDQLSNLDPALAELVDLKFFCGFTFAEVADMRSVSERTVQRDWAKARALLHEYLRPDEAESPV